MNQAELLSLVERLCALPHEAAVVEFKSNWENPRDMGQYLSALGNAAVLERTGQAWLVWGVDNATRAVKGTRFDPFSAKGEGQQSLCMWLTQLTQPRADFAFHAVNHPAGRVVVLTINAPRSAPLAFSGVRYIRVDSHTTKLSEHPDKEQRLWELLGRPSDWTGEVLPEATLDDLDPQAINTARERFTDYLLKSEPDAAKHESLRTQAKSWSVPTLLDKARVTKRGRVTRAALLLLGKDEAAHWLSPADAKLSWVLRQQDNSTRSSQHFGTPWLLATDSRKDVDELLLDKLPDVLSPAQKSSKVRNLLQALRLQGLIHRVGPKASATWLLGPGDDATQN